MGLGGGQGGFRRVRVWEGARGQGSINGLGSRRKVRGLGGRMESGRG